MVTGSPIAAAGLGRRFLRGGGSGNKLNAPDSGFSATLARVSGLPVHVVTRPDNTAVQSVCVAQRVACTLQENPGLSDALTAGVAAAPHWSGWLIHLADMPCAPAALLSQVARSLGGHPIARPFYQGKPGHPLFFSQTLRHKLRALSGDRGVQARRSPLSELLSGVRRHGHPPGYRSAFSSVCRSLIHAIS